LFNLKEINKSLLSRFQRPFSQKIVLVETFSLALPFLESVCRTQATQPVYRFQSILSNIFEKFFMFLRLLPDSQKMNIIVEDLSYLSSLATSVKPADKVFLSASQALFSKQR